MTFVEFAFIHGKEKLFGVIKKIVIQGEMEPVDNGIASDEINSINIDENFIKIKIAQHISGEFPDGFDKIVLDIDITTQQEYLSIFGCASSKTASILVVTTVTSFRSRI